MAQQEMHGRYDVQDGSRSLSKARERRPFRPGVGGRLVMIRP